jgi:adenylylsulfate kinase
MLIRGIRGLILLITLGKYTRAPLFLSLSLLIFTFLNQTRNIILIVEKNMHKGFTIWFTGLSGSGKTTISKIVEKEIRSRGRNVEVLDGDVVRTNLSKGLGFSKEDRDINIRRIGFVANLLTRNGVAVICAAISPYKAIRNENRELIGNGFIEIYVEASVDECARRDVKGLYEKAFKGEIKEFTGVSDPYEPPDNPEIVCHTEQETPEESAAKIIKFLDDRGYL